MEKNFFIFVEKAKKILADAPDHTNKHDKIALLNRKFRLGKKESRLLLEMVKS